jgi:formamidopyrimidine-DNA glycosylase
VPELPEVETVVREIRPHLEGRRLTGVKVSPHPLRRRWSADWEAVLLGQRVTSVRRRGKWIILDLAGGRHLLIHLGMTGQLRVHAAEEESAPHTHLIFNLDRGREQLRFRDVRRFGSALLFENRPELEQFFEGAQLGPEPSDLDPAYWRACLAKTARCLKAVLLDQRVVAGVGNIYADESLFEARLHPARLGKDVTRAEADRLRKAVGHVLNQAINRRGSSIRDYVGGSGERGEYQKEFRVYGRTEQPCVRCRTPIECRRLAGRSTHFCPRCQRLPRAGT